MFLDVTKRRNPELIQTATALHQRGDIPPNTYIIDVDSLKDNTKMLAETAQQHDMTLYFMTKQLGRVPEVADMIAESGIEEAVAVDFDEGKILAEHGIPIGNIGHLVQPGKHQWGEMLHWQPEVITVFSVERARQLTVAAQHAGIHQDILLKVIGPDDKIYDGQEGGLPLAHLAEAIDQIKQFPAVTIVGITTFPNLELNETHTEMVPTENFSTLLKAKRILQEKDIAIKQVNGPSGTSCETIPFLASKGVTHSEPGHGLTGTTPLHAYRDLPEKPAMIYVTEVSHQFADYFQVIAGGYYGRSRMNGCLVGSKGSTILDRYIKAYHGNPESIDYYGKIDKSDDFEIQIGDTAVFAFRSQIFTTRAHVALVEGIQSGEPKIKYFKWRC